MEALIKTCRKHRGTLQTTATLLAIKIAYDGPMNWWDYVCVQARLWKIQLSNLLTAAGPSPSISSLIGANIALWQLLRIEHVHLMEKRKLLRNNMDPFGRLDPNLPHVESLAKRAAEKKKLGMKSMSGKMDMSAANTPILRDVVCIGGGHGHAYVLKSFGMKPIPGVRLTLITRDVMTPYSGMLPLHVAGYYDHDECHIDLCVLARFANATFVHAEAVRVDSDNKLVYLDADHPPVRYDVLSFNIGAAPCLNARQRVHPNLAPVKPIDGFSARWNIILKRIAVSNERTHVVVVGGGAAGCELSLSIQARLRRELEKLGKSPSELLHMTLVSKSEVVMPSHGVGVQKKMLQVLKDRGIHVELGTEAIESTPKSVVCANGKHVRADEVVWCTSAAAQSWLSSVHGLRLDERGFIHVDSHMETSLQNVFACGDIAHLHDPRPKSGVFAVFSGPVVNANIRNAVLGIDRDQWEHYYPQKTFLGLIGTGEQNLVLASKGSLVLAAQWLFELKDWIDRKWMAGYTYALPNMEMKPDEKGMGTRIAKAAGSDALHVLAHATMRCGGCGAKVGSTVLSRVIKRLQRSTEDGGFGGVPIRDEVLIGLDAPDDAAVVQAPGKDMVLVHTVDFFREMVSDAFLFGQIAANHALSDCHAMGADTTSALAIAVVPFGIEAKVENTLYRMMAGACKVLRDNGCALVGGHTCEGQELALGFAVNGVADKEKILAKGGVQPGDAIIITKAVGTGTIMAAEMRRATSGDSWRHAVDSMLMSNYPAALCFQDHGATACTDVTGFGVLGHLVEMLKGSSPPANARVNVSALPVLPGAIECLKKGIFSSLQPANLRLRRAIKNVNSANKRKKYPLLFDPQTAGGLLATVPQHRVQECVVALQELGYARTTVIGSITAEVGPVGNYSDLIEVYGDE